MHRLLPYALGLAIAIPLALFLHPSFDSTSILYNIRPSYLILAIPLLYYLLKLMHLILYYTFHMFTIFQQDAITSALRMADSAADSTFTWVARLTLTSIVRMMFFLYHVDRSARLFFASLLRTARTMKYIGVLEILSGRSRDTTMTEIRSEFRGSVGRRSSVSMDKGGRLVS
jgi:hypothetical protein